MSQNFFERTFGFNIRVPEKTLQQSKKTLVKAVDNLVNPFGEFFEQNKQVFSGDVLAQIDKYNTLNFNIGSQLRQADKNAPVSFDMQG